MLKYEDIFIIFGNYSQFSIDFMAFSHIFKKNFLKPIPKSFNFSVF